MAGSYNVLDEYEVDSSGASPQPPGQAGMHRQVPDLERLLRMYGAELRGDFRCGRIAG